MKLKSLLSKMKKDEDIILSFENGAISCLVSETGKGYKSFEVNEVTTLNGIIKIDIHKTNI